MNSTKAIEALLVRGCQAQRSCRETVMSDSQCSQWLTVLNRPTILAGEGTMGGKKVKVKKNVRESRPSEFAMQFS